MAVLANSFDGGTPGTALTAANSGGANGDPFDEVDPSSSPILFTATSAHGACAVELTAANDDPYFAWQSVVTGTTTYGRAYFRMAAAPPSNTNILRHLAGTQTVITVRVGSNGRLGLLYGTGTFAANGTVTIPNGQWVRIEWTVTTGVGNGSVTAWLFTDPEGTTPADTLSATNINTATAAAVTRQRMGMLSSSTWSFLLDEVAFSNEGPIGPVDTGSTSETGTLNGVLPAIGGQMTGTVHTSATVAGVLPPISGTATAAVSSSGTLSGTLPPVTGSASAAASSSGTLAGNLPPVSGTASGAARAVGAVGGALPRVAGTVTGNARASGTIAGVLPAVQGSVTGTASGPGGHLDGVLPAVTGSVAGAARSSGVLAGALPTVHGTGTAQASANGAVSGLLPAVSGSFTGGEQPAVTAVLDGVLPAIVGHLSGAVRPPETGTLAGLLPPVAGAFSGTASASGSVAGTLPAVTGRIVQHAGQVLPALTGTLITAGQHRGALAQADTLTGTLE